MELAAFRAALGAAVPPDGLPPALVALWWDGRGDWRAAHAAVQAHEGEADCDWVHAYLHRKEGDLANARYWYRRAGHGPATGALDSEWETIATALLAS